jgi:hypothetical protein
MLKRNVVTTCSLQHYLHTQNTHHQFDISQLHYEHTQTIRHVRVARSSTELNGLVTQPWCLVEHA